MFSARYRINRKEFNEVKNQGKIYHSRSFSLIVFQRNDSEASRFGFVISKKVAKKASQRNKIKRVLRELVREFIPRLKGGFSCIFLVRQEVLEKIEAKKRNILVKELAGIFKKAKISL